MVNGGSHAVEGRGGGGIGHEVNSNYYEEVPGSYKLIASEVSIRHIRRGVSRITVLLYTQAV